MLLLSHLVDPIDIFELPMQDQLLDDEVETKHLPGMHDQKKHGRPGAKITTVGEGISPEEYGVPEEYAEALEPNTIPLGTRVEGSRTIPFGDHNSTTVNASGLATGRSRKTRAEAERIIGKLESIYPDTKYFVHYAMDRWQIVQLGDGPVKTVVSKPKGEKKKPKPVVVPDPLPIIPNPIISPELRRTDKTRQYLSEVLGLPERASGYPQFPAAALMLAQGETIVQRAIEDTKIDVPKYLVERAKKDFGFELSLKQPEPFSPESKPSEFYWLTIDEAMKVAANEDKHFRDIRRDERDPEGRPAWFNIDLFESPMGQDIRKNVVDSILDAAMPSRYRYNKDISRSETAVDWTSIDAIKRRVGDTGKISMSDAAEWLESNLLTGESSPPLYTTKQKRAFARRNDGLYLNIGKNRQYNVGEIMVHERGHWVEYGNRDVYQAAQDFLKARRSSTTPVKLGRGYSRWEEAYKDKFIDPYVGKIYSDSTEVISMGMQKIYADRRNFFRSDPDHFMLTLAAIYGEHRPKL